MTKAQHILAIIADSKTNDEAQKRIEEFLKPDYIPENPSDGCPMRDIYSGDDVTDIRPPFPGMRCAHPTSYDPQSGRIYCGEPAYLYGWSRKKPEIYYVMCKQHAKKYRVRLPNDSKT